MSATTVPTLTPKAPTAPAGNVIARTNLKTSLPVSLASGGDLLASVASSLLIYRDLAIAFTTHFIQTWSDRGMGQRMTCSTWLPRPATDQANYFAVGDLMIPDGAGSNPSGRLVGVLVADMPELRVPGKGPALMAPLGFETVGGSQVCRMIAPPGYVALGGIAQFHGEPNLNQYRCVRADLVLGAKPSEAELYDNRGNGRQDSLSVWTVSTPAAPPGKVYLAPQTFIPVGEDGRPAASHFFCLQFDLPDTLAAGQASAQAPTLTSIQAAAETGRGTTFTTFLPWYAVRDAGLSDVQRMQSTPVYSLCRTDIYTLALGQHNGTEAPQRVLFSLTDGIATEDVASFAEAVGISLGTASSFAVPGLAGSIQLKNDFSGVDGSGGLQKTTALQATLTIPPGVNAAVYSLRSSFSLQRMDGTSVTTLQPEFGRPNSMYATQSPAPGSIADNGQKAGAVSIEPVH
jgi:hypothetical protein